jgi:hypothetical protein
LNVCAAADGGATKPVIAAQTNTPPASLEGTSWTDTFTSVFLSLPC